MGGGTDIEASEISTAATIVVGVGMYVCMYVAVCSDNVARFAHGTFKGHTTGASGLSCLSSVQATSNLGMALLPQILDAAKSKSTI